MKKGYLTKIDPGDKRFEVAAAQIREGKFSEGRELLYKMLQQFPDSATCPEAKRIIGEMNLDELFSAENKINKKDYIVQPGDSLALIASKQSSSMDMIVRLNGLMGTTLQPGDHLTIIPLEFSIVVDISEKAVSLRRKTGEKEYFFKEYHASDIRLPNSIKVPAEMEIKGKAAISDGRAVLSTDPRYVDAEKWLPASRNGVVLRTPPVAKAVPVAQTNPKSTVPAIAPTPESGVFMERADLEELFALVRNGSKLYFVR
ncbi:MAG: LysM peptidoglycan-binding domain-containing protein [Verrucomicrobia bacterium]|nr:LysM peptidoglycan-binding domain-containing protein [Verrucomicrobiota bacterium]